MPNWCVNQVDIEGDEADVARLIEFVKGDGDNDEKAFSFRKIVPPPDTKFYSANENQNDFQCGCHPEFVITKEMVQGAEGHEWEEEYGFQPREGYWAVNGVEVKKAPIAQDTIQGVAHSLVSSERSVCPEHNLPSNSDHPDWWYNWNCANWGTKWRAGEVWHDRVDNDNKVDGHTSYNFDTAWSPAEPVIAALAEKFPTLTISHRYCEGGMGYAGEIVYKDGVAIAHDEYGAEDLPDDAWLKDEDGENSWERDYDNVPMNEFEKFCDEHFGGVVGG